jgi:ABC-2 type transport system permease protein
MMSTKGITTDTSQQHARPWQQSDEGAPSLVRTDDPTVARTIGAVGAALVIFGGVALFFSQTATRRIIIGPGWAIFLLAVGLAGLLFHAAFDWDTQVRRLYMAFGYALQMLGIFLCVVRIDKQVGAWFGWGALCLVLGLLFLLAFLRNETDEGLRRLAQFVIGGLGALMALTGLIGGNLPTDFLVPYGLMLAVLGLLYLILFVTSRGTNDAWGYRAGVGLGILGGLVFLIALIQVFAHADAMQFFVPAGILLMLLGVMYAVAWAFLCSDRPLAVLTRRELGAFFYSPMAYIVLFICVLLYAWPYMQFIVQLTTERFPGEQGPAIREPIISFFILQWTPVIFTILVVPALTMRLISEERRAGTLEVLLTVPVSETTVALSKFLAAFVMYALTWAPVGLYLWFLYFDTKKSFDYRPLLSFFIAQAVIGAGCIGMGLFFSSLTRNQIASFLWTTVGMVFLTMIFFVPRMVPASQSETWRLVVDHISYISVWINTLNGKLQLTYLIFFGSMAVLWLFLTVKALEARKWLA